MSSRLRAAATALVAVASSALGCGSGGAGDLFAIAFQVGGSATGNEAALNHQVLITLTSGPAAGLDSSLTVDVATTGLSASAGLDYTTLSTTVTLPVGTLVGGTVPVDLAILDDVLIEGNEVVQLTLSNPTGASELGLQTTHSVTISDDETSPSVAFSAATSLASESIANHSVEVVLSTGAGQMLGVVLAVDVDSTGGTATPGVDYAALDSALTFPIGSGNGAAQLATLQVIANAPAEADESVELTLSSPMPIGALGASATHTVTISETAPPPTLAPPASGRIELQPRPAPSVDGTSGRAKRGSGVRGEPTLPHHSRGDGDPAITEDDGVGAQAPALTGLAHDPELDLLYAAGDAGLLEIELESDRNSVVTAAPYLVALAFDVDHGLLFGVEVEPAGVRLVAIETSTGRLEVLGEFGGAHELSALAFDAARRTLYAADATLSSLVVVDAETGEASHVGAFGLETQGVIEGLAFDPTTASLFGILAGTDDGTPDQLVVIDVESGAATPVGSGLGLGAGITPLGLGYDGIADAFFVSDQVGRLYRVDKETGGATAR